MQRLKIEKNKFFSICISIILLVIYLLFLKEQKGLYEECVVSTIVLVVSFGVLFFRYKKMTGGMLFYACMLIMHCGQMFLIALKMDFSESLKSSIAIGDTIPRSFETVVITTFLCLVVACTICVFENEEGDNKKGILNSNRTVRITQLGWVVIGTIIALTVISDIVRIVQVSMVGYAYGYHQNNTILYYADFLFPLCYFFVITVYKNNWRVIRVVFFLVAFRDVYCAFLIGSRGEAVLDIIMCVFAISKITTNWEIKNRIKRIFIISCIAGFVLLPFTGLLRADRSLSFASFLRENNPLSYSLTEFGGSIVNVKLALENQRVLPVINFCASFLTIIPMSTRFIPSEIISYGNAYASYLNIAFGGGLGGSVLGEAIFWFGEGFGAACYMIVYAMIIILSMNKLKKDNQSMSFINNTVILFLIYEMFYQIRGSISSFQAGLKILIYFWIIMTLFGKYIFSYSTVE